MAKQIAKYLHKDNKKVGVVFVCGRVLLAFNMQGFIRLDMSEYQEKHEVMSDHVTHFPWST